jgi:hypothetical protein
VFALTGIRTRCLIRESKSVTRFSQSAGLAVTMISRHEIGVVRDHELIEANVLLAL